MAREAISKENVTLFRCTNFSAIATGEHELFTTAPTPFMPIFLIVMLRQVAGFESVPSLSIGTNANVDNILPITPMAGLDVAGEYARLPLGTALAGGVFRGMSALDSVTLKAKVTTAAVASQYEIEVQLVGAYV